MYCKYATSSNVTSGLLLSDFVAAFTGENNVSNFSTSCDIPNSEIITDVSAGWIVHDNPGGDYQVLKASHLDSPAQYKFVKIEIINGSVKLTAYESWDEISHTGINQNPAAPIVNNVSTLTVVHLFSSERMLGLRVTGSYAFPICTEYTRDTIWNTISSGYPSFGIYQVGSGFYPVRTRHDYYFNIEYIEQSDTVTTAFSVTGEQSRQMDENEELHWPFIPITITNTNKWAYILGQISSIADIWSAPTDVLRDDDIVPHQNNDYIFFQISSGFEGIFIRKG